MRTSVNAGKKRVTFQLTAEPGSAVHVAGSFNNWDGAAKQMKDKNGSGRYSTVVFLPRGRHEYKFLVDGKWCVDPECTDWVPNAHGSLNSVIVVE
jgi:1,4-alpha-glucan branching enzyme